VGEHAGGSQAITGALEHSRSEHVFHYRRLEGGGRNRFTIEKEANEESQRTSLIQLIAEKRAVPRRAPGSFGEAERLKAWLRVAGGKDE
jgi:hypothetical protein